MDNESVAVKIRKLLEMSIENGATEAEAETAMNMATMLMIKYGIDNPRINSDIGEFVVDEAKKREPWLVNLTAATAILCGCDYFSRVGSKACFYVIIEQDGNRESAQALYDYLKTQVGFWYKVNLPRGLTKTKRAEFRRNFKYACAGRVRTKAREIVDQLKKYDGDETGRALIVSTHYENKLNDIAKWMEKKGYCIRTTKSKKRTTTYGLVEGVVAADNIPLQGQLK